jgi:DNA-binding NarL/FixJ family response regulator
LSDANDITVVGGAGDVAEALTLIEAVQPNVVVMDLLMPGIAGVTGMSQVCQRFPTVRRLVLTTADERKSAQQALDAGAAAYLVKDTMGHHLASVIRAIAAV